MSFKGKIKLIKFSKKENNMKNDKSSRFLAAIILLVLLIVGVAVASTTVIDLVKANRAVQCQYVQSTELDGDKSVAINGTLLVVGVKLTGTADGNDVNGLDITIRDEFDNTIVSEANVTDGWKEAVTIADGSSNYYGGVPVATAVDVNFVYNNPSQTVKIILWYKSEKGW